jgi:signal transduction histidine kinase
MCTLYRRKADIPMATKMYDLALPILQQTKQEKEIAIVHNHACTIYTAIGDYPKALALIQKAMIINERLGELESLTGNLNNIGFIQNSLGEYNAAITSLNKAVAINEKLGNKMWVAIHKDNIATAHFGLKEYDKSLAILKNALAVNEEVGNTTSACINLYNIGKTLLALEQYSEAVTALLRSLDLGTKTNDRHNQAWAYTYLGSAYQKSNIDLPEGANRTVRLQKAVFYYQEALKKSLATGVHAKSIALEGLSKIYEEQALFRESYDFYKKYIALKDSISGEDVKKQITRKEIQYEFDKKETELKYQQQLTTGELEKQRLLTFQQGQTLTLKEQALALSNKDLLLSNKEKDLEHLAYLKEQAEKQEKEQELSLSQEREKGKERDLSLKNLELSAQQKQNLYLGLFSFFLLGGLGILSYFYTTLKKQKNIIAQQNELNEHTIAILSHDIKEPLLGVNLLLKKLNKDDPFVAQASQSLESQINSVNGILTNLLKMKKLSLSKKDKSASANANMVVQNVVQELSVAIQGKALTIQNELSDNVILPIAPEKLQIIVNNLLSNAVKYSFSNQCIRIFQDGKGFAIQDFGVGLSPEQRNKIMREVTASQSGTNQERGNGLGLFLVGAMLKGEQIRVLFDSPEVGGTIVKVLG